MIITLSKINLSKIGWVGGGSTSIWIMALNILFFFGRHPLWTFSKLCMTYVEKVECYEAHTSGQHIAPTSSQCTTL